MKTQLWRIPMTPVLKEAEAGGLRTLGYSLSYIARSCLKNKTKTRITYRVSLGFDDYGTKGDEISLSI